ncbi:hypothetical protein VO64_3650 [Pseudomonas synxantha]|uniref:Uncharacterized protein n=1 Tax=Pseudomonas synxantha TaxID=47883 RepID=A0AAU8TQ00_9PSED|nr:hypothetical protein VO64_3650 [Pseudomonas synxantha]
MTLRKRWHTASKRTALKDGQSASLAAIKRGGWLRMRSVWEGACPRLHYVSQLICS